MKKINVFLLFIPMFFLVGCAGNSPESVAEEFTKSLYTADFEGAKAMCTEDTQQSIDFVAAFASKSVDEMKKCNIEYSVTNVTLSDDGNSAEIEGIVNGSYNLQKGEVKDSVKTKLHLIKSEDKWLVKYKFK